MFSSTFVSRAIVRSYDHIVIALAGAAFTKLTGSPRYRPLAPSLFKICLIVANTPVYSGMFRCTYRDLVGPCTCSLFLIVSRGKTADFENTLANTPATASPEPTGSDRPANGIFRVSYEAKKRPMYGTIWPTAAVKPWKKPFGPSCFVISLMLASKPV